MPGATIIFLNGASSAGKSSLAKALLRALPLAPFEVFFVGVHCPSAYAGRPYRRGSRAPGGLTRHVCHMNDRRRSKVMVWNDPPQGPVFSARTAMTVRIPARRRHTGFRVLVIAAALVVGTAALAGPTGAARVRHDRHGRHRYAGQPLRPSVAQVSPASFEFEIPHPASGSYPARVTLTVTGNRFRAGAAVLFNGRAVPTTFVSPARLTAQVPFDWVRSVAMASPSGGPDGFHGNATVTVRNPGRQGGRSSARAFSVHATPID